MRLISSPEGTSVAVIDGVVKPWLARRLGCSAGRRDYAMGRFVIALCRDAAERTHAEHVFAQRVRAWQSTSLLLVLEPRVTRLPARGASETLARIVSTLYPEHPPGECRVPPRRIGAPCPVTGHEVMIPDFDSVAFFPQALDEADPLYDPSTAAPLACVNQTADLFSVSLMARDLSYKLFGAPPRQISWDQRDRLFFKIQSIWQHMAEKTIGCFGKATNPAILCPAQTSPDGNYYLTPHDESAFGESVKREHISEMPNLYVPRLVHEWRRSLGTGAPPHLDYVNRPALCPMLIRRLEGA